MREEFLIKTVHYNLTRCRRNKAQRPAKRPQTPHVRTSRPPMTNSDEQDFLPFSFRLLLYSLYSLRRINCFFHYHYFKSQCVKIVDKSFEHCELLILANTNERITMDLWTLTCTPHLLSMYY